MYKLNNIFDIKNDEFLYDEQFNIFSIVKNQYIKMRVDSKGYYYVQLRDVMNNSKKYRVHRLLAAIYLPTENMENLYINHKDGNKLNNDLNNLEWVTASENALHWHRDLKPETDYFIWNRDGEIIATIKCRSELAELLNMSPTAITTALKRQNKIRGLLITQRKQHFTSEMAIYEYQKTGKYPIIFKDSLYVSKRELARELKVNHTEIQRRLSNGSISYFNPQNIADVQRLSRSGE